MKHYRAIGLAGASLLAVGIFVGSANAEEVAEEGVSVDNYIVVTARRRDESIQDVPQVVNAVTADTIEKLNIRSLQDIQSVVPGLELTAAPNGIGQVTTVRGVAFDANQSGNNGTVQFYYNDAPITANVLLQTMFDVGQVEVQRGPQGTLRGRSTPSGSINVTMRRPNLSEPGGVMNGTATFVGGYNVNGAINVPVIEDKLGIRVAGVISDDEGARIRPIANGRELNNRSRGFRASVRAIPVDALTLDFSYQGFNTRSLGYTQLESLNQFGPTSSAAPSPVTIRARDRLAADSLANDTNQSFKTYSGQAQLDLLGQRLTYVFLKLDMGVRSFAPTDNVGIVTAAGATLPDGRQWGLYNILKNSDISHEVRLQNVERVGGIFDYVVGALKYKTQSNTLFTSYTPRTFTPAPPAPNVQITAFTGSPLERYATSEEKSLFGNLTAHIGDSTEISGGARHIWFMTDSGLRSSGAEIAALRLANQRDEATIFTTSLKHNFSRDVMAYVTYGTSWRPRTIVIPGISFPTALQASFQRSAPESARNLEAGIKSSWFDEKVTINVSGYWQKFKNYPYRSNSVPYIRYLTLAAQQANNTSAAGAQIATAAFVTSADLEVKGIEADFAFQPTGRFSISGTVSYSDGNLSNAQVPCLDLDGNGIADTGTPTMAAYLAKVSPGVGLQTCPFNFRANNAPPFSFSLRSEYNHPLSDKVAGFIRGLLSFKGASIGNPTNPYDSVNAYGLLNLYAGLRDPDGAWEVTLYGKNITNTFRTLTRSAGAGSAAIGGTQSFTNYFTITSTEPREFGITGRFSFGSK